MNKQPSSTIMTRLCWGVFFLALLFLAFQVMPRALGQRDASKASVAKPQATVNLAAAGKQGGAPASLVGASQATQRKSGAVQRELPYDVRALPPQAPKFPYSSVPMATPSCTPIVVNGSIDSSDPTQVDRLFRSGIPQTCPASTLCAIFGDPTPRHYDEYAFTNTTGAPQCVTVVTNTACTGTNYIFTGAYLGSFDPNNICTNWIGDSGSSPDPEVAFQVDLDDGQTLVLAVSEVTPETGCPDYTVTITGLCGPCMGGNGPWTQATPYPTTIVRYGFAQTATHFYVFGGVNDGTIVNTVNRMDLATGVWEPRAAMPTTGGEAPTCALDATAGTVYCTDGSNGSGFFSYDIATDSWTTLASIPQSDTYGSASGAFNGKVFVAGGSGGITNAVWVYDIGTNSWSAGTAAPNVFLLAGYQQVGQFLYVVGGFDPTFVNNATTSRLDMSSAPGVWEAGPAFTPQRADFGLAYDAGTNTLYALGGDLPNDGNPFASTNLVDELSVAGWPGGTWTASPPDLPLPNRQANQAGFYGNGEIWSVGGIDGFTFIFTAEVLHRTNGSCPGNLTLESAASLGRGGFAIDLPLTGPSGVEDRSTGPNGKLKITMTFNNNIVSVQGAGVSCGGGLKSLIIDGNTVTTNWVAVPHGCNGSDNIVTLTDILDDQGNTLGSASVPVGLLLGDANGDRVVNPADRQYVKGFKGQKIDSTNFRADVSSDGYIGVSDVRLVEKQQGTSLP